MSNKFAVVIVYFGQFKKSISLFLASCTRNPDVDWLFFTDCPIPDEIDLKKNIIWHQTTLNKIRALAEEKLKIKIPLTKAYKLCDLKPFYGTIFSDYLTDYEYWGFGDVDVIYGQIAQFLEKINYSIYDKINWMGHLCFVRNVDVCNQAFFTDVKNTVDWKKVVCSDHNIGFDERDANIKFLSNGLKIYSGKWAADIDIFYWRMRCVDKKTLHFLLDTWELKYAPSNYPYQIFAVLNGLTYRIYLRGKKVIREEFAYIHFRREIPILISPDSLNYLITRDGFIPISENIFDDYDAVKEYTIKYNRQENAVQEIKNFLYQLYRKISGKRGW